MTRLDIAYEDTKVFINAHPTLKEKALEVFYWMEQEIEDGASEDLSLIHISEPTRRS